MSTIDECPTCARPVDECDCRTRLFSEEFGISSIPPWEIRGIVIHPRVEVGDPIDFWPGIALAPTIDICESIADFYTLLSITGRVFDENPGGLLLDLVIIEASRHLKDHTDLLDTVLRDYFWASIGGELRHHRALCERVLSVDRAEAWAGWRQIVDGVGVEVLLDAAYLFGEFADGYDEEPPFGGSRWQAAARLLHQRETNVLGPDDFTNKVIFVDRAFSLQHNTGSMLSKGLWAKNDGGLAPENVKWLLDAHGARKPIITRLLRGCSPAVRQVFDTYWQVAATDPHPMSTQILCCEACMGSATIGHFYHCPRPSVSGYTMSAYPDEVEEAAFHDTYMFGPDGSILLFADEDYELSIVDVNGAPLFYRNLAWYEVPSLVCPSQPMMIVLKSGEHAFELKPRLPRLTDTGTYPLADLTKMKFAFRAHR